MKEERKYQERRETRRYNSSDRESELRPSDEERRRAAAHAAPTDSPAMVSAFRLCSFYWHTQINFDKLKRTY